jgi:hypothetical protein
VQKAPTTDALGQLGSLLGKLPVQELLEFRCSSQLVQAAPELRSAGALQPTPHFLQFECLAR